MARPAAPQASTHPPPLPLPLAPAPPPHRNAPDPHPAPGRPTWPRGPPWAQAPDRPANVRSVTRPAIIHYYSPDDQLWRRPRLCQVEQVHPRVVSGAGQQRPRRERRGGHVGVALLDAVQASLVDRQGVPGRGGTGQGVAGQGGREVAGRVEGRRRRGAGAWPPGRCGGGGGRTLGRGPPPPPSCGHSAVVLPLRCHTQVH